MDRGDGGFFDHSTILDIEGSTDLLALEIISPEDEVRRRVAQTKRQEYNHSLSEVAAKILSEEFGLPSGVDENYAHYLYPNVHSSSIRGWLRQR
jgi:hypothetical protein